MFDNYRYFLTIAEEGSISRAAGKLFVTHQCLSRYLSQLEKECGTPLFHRKPFFSLTEEGEMLLEAFQKASRLENDTRAAFDETIHGETGSVRIGTTSGRFRVLMPDLIEHYKAAYPGVGLFVSSASVSVLRQMLLENRLDLAVTGTTAEIPRYLRCIPLMQERLYLVISDEMLRTYFPDEYPECIGSFIKFGADLTRFQQIPFCVNPPESISAQMLHRHLEKLGISLDDAFSSKYPDMHYVLTQRNFAASFCMSMYLPYIEKLNHRPGYINRLHVFPIRGLAATNHVAAEHLSSRRFTRYEDALLRLLKRQCLQYIKLEPALPEM